MTKNEQEPKKPKKTIRDMKLAKFLIFLLFLWHTMPLIATGQEYNQTSRGRPLDIFLLIDYSQSIVPTFEKEIVRAIFDELNTLGGAVRPDRLHVSFFADRNCPVTRGLSGYSFHKKIQLRDDIIDIIEKKENAGNLSEPPGSLNRLITNFVNFKKGISEKNCLRECRELIEAEYSHESIEDLKIILSNQNTVLLIVSDGLNDPDNTRKVYAPPSEMDRDLREFDKLRDQISGIKEATVHKERLNIKVALFAISLPPAGRYAFENEWKNPLMAGRYYYKMDTKKNIHDTIRLAFSYLRREHAAVEVDIEDKKFPVKADQKTSIEIFFKKNIEEEILLAFEIPTGKELLNGNCKAKIFLENDETERVIRLNEQKTIFKKFDLKIDNIKPNNEIKMPINMTPLNKEERGPSITVSVKPEYITFVRNPNWLFRCRWIFFCMALVLLILVLYFVIGNRFCSLTLNRFGWISEYFILIIGLIVGFILLIGLNYLIEQGKLSMPSLYEWVSLLTLWILFFIWTDMMVRKKFRKSGKWEEFKKSTTFIPTLATIFGLIINLIIAIIEYLLK